MIIVALAILAVLGYKILKSRYPFSKPTEDRKNDHANRQQDQMGEM